MNWVDVNKQDEIRLTITSNKGEINNYIVSGTNVKMTEVFQNFLEASRNENIGELNKTIKSIRYTAEGGNKRYAEYKCFYTPNGIEFRRVITDKEKSGDKEDKVMVTLKKVNGVRLPPANVAGNDSGIPLRVGRILQNPAARPSTQAEALKPAESELSEAERAAMTKAATHSEAMSPVLQELEKEFEEQAELLKSVEEDIVKIENANENDNSLQRQELGQNIDSIDKKLEKYEKKKHSIKEKIESSSELQKYFETKISILDTNSNSLRDRLGALYQ